MPEKSLVTITIFNNIGQKIKTLVHEHKIAGIYNVYWNGRDDSGNKVPSGVYYCYMTNHNGFNQSKKLLLIK
jgi:flagellar hook assembly protein FlgD